ncbi:MAG: hypothetical protein HY784_08550 [Chloroflexi bacterium]|nr:hypothetical protein [Chloroflexota bacterium]
MRKPPATLVLYTACAAVIGGWMTYDGLHQRLTGDFVRTGGQLGPWAAIPRALGVDPLSMGFFFVVLGLEWIAAACGLWLGRRWGYNLAVGLSLLGLLYAPFGTLVSALALLALLLRPTRDWVDNQ